MVLRKSNSRTLDFQISWCQQMPKHKTRNIFHWINLEVNTVNEIWPVYVIPKEIISSKNSTETAAWKLVPGPKN